MEKLFVYGCTKEEQKLFENLAEEKHLKNQFKMSEDVLCMQNVKLSKGCSCISISHDADVTAEVLDALKEQGIKYLSTRSIGTDHIDMEHAAQIGVQVTNVRYSVNSVADYTIMLLFMALRQAKILLQRTKIRDYSLPEIAGREIQDLTVGVIGTGHIGSTVIRHLSGFGCEILAYDCRENPAVADLASYVDLDTLLEKSDAITLHMPATEETQHLINWDRIQQMKQDVILINTGRGNLIDTKALLAGIECGKIGAAALDVVENEKEFLYKNCQEQACMNREMILLESYPNVIVTPHMAFYTRQAVRDMVQNSLESCMEFLREQEMQTDGEQKKCKVAVLFGGMSDEHDISLKSAYNVLSHMDRDRYEPFMIGITKKGEWYLYEGPVELLLEEKWLSAQFCTPVVMAPNANLHGFLELRGGIAALQKVDVVFPVLHGRGGEDGSIQGLLELSGIPYVGCNVYASVLGMDKNIAHQNAKKAGVHVTKSVVLFSYEKLEDKLAEIADLRYPLFVKPAASGSSFGVTMVKDEAMLREAVELALTFGDKILIEEGVQGCEVGCAILGNGEHLTVGAVDQIELSHGFFRIHQEKNPEQASENSVIHVPAHLPEETMERIKVEAKKIYRSLGCSGLTRVDMFLTPEDDVVFNEVNTMPGFTVYSRYPRMMEAVGITVEQVIDEVIDLAWHHSDTEK